MESNKAEGIVTRYFRRLQGLVLFLTFKHRCLGRVKLGITFLSVAAIVIMRLCDIKPKTFFNLIHV